MNQAIPEYSQENNQKYVHHDRKTLCELAFFKFILTKFLICTQN